MYTIMDIGCPDAGGEKQQFVGQKVHGDVQQRPAVGDCLVRKGHTIVIEHPPYTKPNHCRAGPSHLRGEESRRTIYMGTLSCGIELQWARVYLLQLQRKSRLPARCHRRG